MELSQLRQEWEAARNGGLGGNNAPIQDHEIDVVGDDESDDEDEVSAASAASGGASPPVSTTSGGDSVSPPTVAAHHPLLLSQQHQRQPHNTFSPALFGNSGGGGLATTNVLKLRNNFSIDNLLAVRSTLIKEEQTAAGDTDIKQESV